MGGGAEEWQNCIHTYVYTQSTGVGIVPIVQMSAVIASMSNK